MQNWMLRALLWKYNKAGMLMLPAVITTRTTGRLAGSSGMS